MSRKEALEQSYSDYKRKLESELEDIKSNVQSVGKKALIVGAGVLAVYGLVSLFSKDKSEDSTDAEKSNKGSEKAQLSKRSKKKSNANYLGQVVKEQALVFILGLAAQKLGDFLRELEHNKKESDS
jgi:cell division protein ZapA (FtsZ GTPase activity inhibitor)